MYRRPYMALFAALGLAAAACTSGGGSAPPAGGASPVVNATTAASVVGSPGPTRPAAVASPATSPATQPASPVAQASPATQASPASQAASGTPYDIQTIVSATGQAAFIGKEEQQAFKALESVVNQQGGISGHPVHFVVADDQTNPSVAVQLANQVIAKKVPVLLGSSIVADCNAIAPLVSQGPVLYCLSPGIHPANGSFAFSSTASTVSLAERAVDYFRAKGWTKIATLTSSDATGQDADGSIKEALALPANSSVKIVSAEHFNTTDVSVDAQIARIKGTNPQALIAWATGNPIATVFKSLKQSGLDIPVVTTNGNMTYAQMQQYSAFLPNQLLIPATQWAAYPNVSGPAKPAIESFFNAFKAQGVKPDIGQTLAWDPGLLVIDALRHVGTNASASQVRDYLDNLTGFAGVNGVYDFKKTPQRGLTVDQMIMTRWDATQKTWVLQSAGS